MKKKYFLALLARNSRPFTLIMWPDRNECYCTLRLMCGATADHTVLSRHQTGSAPMFRQLALYHRWVPAGTPAD